MDLLSYRFDSGLARTIIIIRPLPQFILSCRISVWQPDPPLVLSWDWFRTLDTLSGAPFDPMGTASWDISPSRWFFPHGSRYGSSPYSELHSLTAEDGHARWDRVGSVSCRVRVFLTYISQVTARRRTFFAGDLESFQRWTLVSVGVLSGHPIGRSTAPNTCGPSINNCLLLRSPALSGQLLDVVGGLL